MRGPIQLSDFDPSECIDIANSNLRIAPFRKSEAAYEALAAIILKVHPEWARPVGHVKSHDAGRPSYCTHERWFIIDDDRVVGCANYTHLVWAFNPQHFIINIGLADELPQSVWNAVHAFILECLSSFKPTKLIICAIENRSHEIAALTERGYVRKTRCPRSQLDVHSFNSERFQPVRERFAKRGYVIETARRLAQSDADFETKLYAVAMEADADMPMKVDFTPPPIEVWRRYIFENPYFMPDAFFVARHNETYLGLSDLRGPTVDPKRLDVGFTGVARAYRRQGVATALKLATVDFAKQADAHFIWTENDETNPMYTINVNLGFVPLPALHEFHLDL